MSEAILVAIITGGMSLVGCIISSRKSSQEVAAKVANSLTTHQAVTDTKLDELTREVREHNNFARRIPIIEEKLKSTDHRLNLLERKMYHDGTEQI